jgi:hypothetical protein
MMHEKLIWLMLLTINSRTQLLLLGRVSKIESIKGRFEELWLIAEVTFVGWIIGL